MGDSNREKWLQVLETVARKRPDEAEQEWSWIMRELEIAPDDFLAVMEAVRQGRWREAENPAGYIKAVAKREKRRAGEAGVPGEHVPSGLRGFQGLEAKGEEITVDPKGFEFDEERLSAEEVLDHLEFRQGQPMKGQDGAWRTPSGPEFDQDGLLHRRVTRRGLPRARAQSQMERLVRYAEKLEGIRAAQGKDERDEPYMEQRRERDPDWQKLAEAAGLSDWEKKAAEYKYLRVSWTDAMRAQPDEESRRALQAAWKKLERTGLRRLRAAEEEINGI